MYELVAANFQVPSGFEQDEFRLRMLTVDDVVKDFDAICDRVDRFGAPKPPFVDTVAEDLVDLGWHQGEFSRRRSFAYTVVVPDESQIIGCVYVNPSETHDARVWMWVRKGAWDKGLDSQLEAAVREWLSREWPFQRIDWADREPEIVSDQQPAT